MKYYKQTVVVIIVLALGIFAFTKNQPEKLTIEESQLPNNEGINFCYIWNTESGDSASLKMNLTGSGGSIANGSFVYMPAQKDKKTGTFTGIAGPVDKMAMARTAKLVWTAMGEGTTNKEELYIKFGEGNAYPAFGEMVMGADGVYVYKNPNNLSYPIAMQETECTDSTLIN